MKRIRIIVMVVAVVVIGVVAIVCFRAREPRYQGRTLSEWIWVGTDHIETSPEWSEANNAVKQIGTNAIPFLLEWVQAEDTPQKEKVVFWLNEHAPFHFHIESAADRRFAARMGFMMLGNESKPAWPALSQWTFSTNRMLRYMAFDCLAGTSTDEKTMLSVLTRLLHDPDKAIQIYAARVFKDRYPQEAEQAGVYKMFPELTDGIMPHRHILPPPKK